MTASVRLRGRAVEHQLLRPDAIRAGEPFSFVLPLLAVILAGYLFFDRPFAYVSLPGVPFYPGELLLLSFALALPRVRQHLRFVVGQGGTVGWLLAFLAFGVIRLALDLPEYKLLAVRDAAIFYYAAGAIGMCVLLRFRPASAEALLRGYRTVLPLFVLWAPFAVVLSRAIGSDGPVWPGTETALTSFRPGNVAVHCGIALAYLWLVDRSTSRQWRALLTLFALSSLVVAGSQNRGGLVAALCALVLVALRSPQARSFVTTAAAAVALVLVGGLITGFTVELGDRDLSVAQVVENVRGSVGEEAESNQLGGTVAWRLTFWGSIVGDIGDGIGPLGLGFGPNIADRYGYQVTDQEQSLRSAHNSHMSILARMGPLGLVLWVGVWVSWYRALHRRERLNGRALRRSPELTALISWLSISVLALHVNAIFDPTLESPQVALWLWAFFGIGLAVSSPRRSGAGVRSPARTR